jgi:hypothetical protein
MIPSTNVLEVHSYSLDLASRPLYSCSSVRIWMIHVGLHRQVSDLRPIACLRTPLPSTAGIRPVCLSCPTIASVYVMRPALSTAPVDRAHRLAARARRNHRAQPPSHSEATTVASSAGPLAPGRCSASRLCMSRRLRSPACSRRPLPAPANMSV